MKNAIFPGSFDPFTLGHLDIVKKSEKIFDKIVIGIGENDSKKPLFSIEKRKKIIEKIFKKNKKIIVKDYNCLTVDFCKINNLRFIIRGLRNSSDFQKEKELALMNEALDKSIITLFLPCSKKYSIISSSLVKELILKKGEFNKFVPKEILDELKSF
ncbi:MAG: pantetheine-phosphate adenylyltransferase [Flavobacteriales bacterium]|nr:pantetheine-phosphate adenylyltransferase [Flavobacteriales bacterium]|tara:strand:+ start:19668 stop:20138 length:471 start_codon:yes stop_codon:yes gene_type:complete